MPHKSATFPANLTGKPLYTFYAILITVVALPYHIFINLLPSFRPHPRWTFQQSLMNHLMRVFLYHASILELQTPLDLSSISASPNSAVIPPAEERLYHGVLAPIKETKPCSIGGVWYPSPFQRGTDHNGTVFLYFHGGAFVIGTCQPDVCGFAASTLTSTFPDSKFLAFSYRLASKDTSCAFPAALQDSLSAYVYLLDQGVSAQRIILAADSAGCNLAIGLLRYLASLHGSALQIPEPRAAILCSPWVDVYATRAPSTAFKSIFHRTPTDYVPPELQLWGARSYIPTTTSSESDTYISPHHHPFITSTSLFVLIGGGEVLAEEGAKWAREMETAKCSIKLESVPLANHAILGVGGIMGWRKETEQAIRKARQWIEEAI